MRISSRPIVPTATISPCTATGDSEQDYCNAFRAAYWFRGNSEKVIEVHAGLGTNAWNGDWNVEGMDEFGMALFTLEYMEMFGMADGRNFPYDDVFNTDNPNNVDIFVNRDPRLYETMVVNRNNLVEQYQGFRAPRCGKAVMSTRPSILLLPTIHGLPA